MDEIETTIAQEIEETQETASETLTESLINAGITREEIVEAMKEALQTQATTAPAVDYARAEKEYFKSLIK